jgi:carbonic anhydrase/acetyltransferase-like protein (isoleucine patch superfamily)
MLIRHRGAEPAVDKTAWVAPSATLVGDVRIGPRTRIMYGAVLDAEGAHIEIGSACVVAEHAVLRATAVGDPRRPVIIGDHVFVSPHATLLGCAVERCAYVATGATILHGARLAAGAVVAVGALVHANTVVPPEFFIPPFTIAVGDPVRVLTPDRTDEVAAAIKEVNFAATAFGVDAAWEDRIRRYERITEVRVAEFGAHEDDAEVTPPS